MVRIFHLLQMSTPDTWLQERPPAGDRHGRLIPGLAARKCESTAEPPKYRRRPAGVSAPQSRSASPALPQRRNRDKEDSGSPRASALRTWPSRSTIALVCRALAGSASMAASAAAYADRASFLRPACSRISPRRASHVSLRGDWAASVSSRTSAASTRPRFSSSSTAKSAARESGRAWPSRHRDRQAPH